jgi:hypothetical protein
MSEKEWLPRKNRSLKVREGFPESLRDIPLRYVEGVAVLSPDSLSALDQAYRIEKVNIPRALQYIRTHPIINIEDLIEFARPEKRGPKSKSERTSNLSHTPQQNELTVSFPDDRDIQSLSGLLVACYPGMPKVTADAMAASEVMKEALKVVAATREALESDHARSDFVILSLFQLFSQSKKKVLEIIQGNPAFQKAFEQSRVALD